MALNREINMNSRKERKERRDKGGPYSRLCCSLRSLRCLRLKKTKNPNENKNPNRKPQNKPRD